MNGVGVSSLNSLIAGLINVLPGVKKGGTKTGSHRKPVNNGHCTADAAVVTVFSELGNISFFKTEHARSFFSTPPAFVKS